MRQALEPTDYPFFDYRRFTFSLAIATSKGVWLAGSTAVRFDAASKKMVVTGDLVAQAEVIHDKMAKTLVPGSLGLANITRLVQYVTPAALPDLPRLMALHASHLAHPSISTIVVNRLLREEALIEIEAVASADGSSAVHHLPTVNAPSPDQARQSAIWQLEAADYRRHEVLRTLEMRSADVVPVAHGNGGTFAEIVVPCLADGSRGVQIEMAVSHGKAVTYATALGDPAVGGIVAQTRHAYDQLRRAGLDFSRVVKTTEFITPEGLVAYRGTADVRREVFEAPYPAATGVICERLPRAGAQIAVEAIAVNEDFASVISAELKNWIGRTATYVAPEEVGQASIRYYALALADDNPLYQDPASAAASRHGAIIAPPTMVCETSQFIHQPPAQNGYFGHSWPLPIKCERFIRGGNEYEFIQPMTATDRVTTTWTITNIYERITKSFGQAIFVISEARYVNQRNELLAINRETNIYTS